MPDRIRIEWAYKPVDYFEDRLVANLEGIDIEIYNGSVIVEFDAKTFDNDPSIRDRLEQYTQSLFKGARLQSHAEFEISGGAVYRLHPGGRTDVTIFAETAGALAMAGSLDIKVTDSTGKVIKDTRQERFNEKRHFALAVASQRGKDATLDSMLASYDAAVRDPKNELVHLYEIRDALAARFGGETKARTGGEGICPGQNRVEP